MMMLRMVGDWRVTELAVIIGKVRSSLSGRGSSTLIIEGKECCGRIVSDSGLVCFQDLV
jgi:hypothetical protein